MVVEPDCIFVIRIFNYDFRLDIFECFFDRFLLLARNQITMNLIKSIDYTLTDSITSCVE